MAQSLRLFNFGGWRLWVGLDASVWMIGTGIKARSPCSIAVSLVARVVVKPGGKVRLAPASSVFPEPPEVWVTPVLANLRTNDPRL